MPKTLRYSRTTNRSALTRRAGIPFFRVIRVVRGQLDVRSRPLQLSCFSCIQVSASRPKMPRRMRTLVFSEGAQTSKTAMMP